MIYSSRGDALRRRLIEDAGWIAFGLAALFAVAALVMSPLGFDLRVYLEAARHVAAGRSPYAPPDSDRCRDPGCFYYPPPVALLFVPLTGIPFPIATMAGVAFLGGSAAVLATIALARSPRVLRPWAAISIVLFFPLLLDIRIVNLDTLTTTLALLAWRLRDRPVRGGVVLAAAVGLKLVAAPVVLFYVAARRWRQLAWAAAATALVAVVTAPWVGPYWLDFIAAASDRSAIPGIGAEALGSTPAYLALPGVGVAILLAAGIAARGARDRADDGHALALASAPLLAYGITYPFLVLALPLLVATMAALASRPALLALPLGAWLAMEAPLGSELWRFGGYIATLVLGAVLFLPTVARRPRSAGDDGGIRWLALGDSFTIGTGVAPDHAFPAVLARRWNERGIRCEVTNPSVNGYTTDDLIRDELPLAGAIRPTLVTVLIGANDIVRGSDEGAYRSRLASIYRDLLAAPVEPSSIRALPQPDWSLSPAGASYGDPAGIARTIERFNDIAREEAERAGGRYVDIFPLMREQAQRGMLAPDGLHPSAEAHEQWAAALDDLLTPDRPPGSPRP